MLQKITSIQEKKYKIITWIIAGVVFLVVLLIKNPLIPKPAKVPSWVYVLPLLNALLNGTCFIFLMASFYFIKKKNTIMHQKLNTFAMILSVIFLISYVVFHTLVPETLYGDSNKDRIVDEMELSALIIPRSIYLFVLITHIALAAIILPFILQTFYYGMNRMNEKHKKLSRKIFPLWLYVAATGVMVYVLVSPFY